MTSHSIRAVDLLAVALWLGSLAWTAWGSSAAVHRQLLAAAVAATLVAVSARQRREIREVMRLTWRAARPADQPAAVTKRA